MRVAGLISGTSVDGIDVAVVDTSETPDGVHVETVAATTVAYPPGVREAILAASNAPTHTAAVSRLNFLIGELFAAAVQRAGVPLDTIELIGSHGQTIFHEGEPVDVCGFAVASTLQIGEPAVIAERTGIPVVADFRVADMAAGGKGAPLVPYFDYLLFRDAAHGRAALNIGGIANITVLPAGASLADIVAFDTGPGNMLIDALAGGIDRNGELARSGCVDESLLARLLTDPYYSKQPPKTAGREQYGKSLLQSFPQRPRADLVATVTELTARTITDAVNGYSGVSEVIASGGGTHNEYLMERLRTLLHARLRVSSEFGIDADAKEAIAFAVLAYETWRRRPSNVPRATGARRPVVLGKICNPGHILS